MRMLLPLAGALTVLQEAESLEARVDAVRSAIWARNEKSLNEADRWYPVDVLEDAVILRRGEQFARATYTISAEGAVEFGEPERVALEYVPVRVQESTDRPVLSLHEAVDGERRGLVWDVVIIRPGHTLNGTYYSPQLLQESVHLFEGVHVYVLDDTTNGHKKNPLEKTQGQLAGWIEGAAYQESVGVTARLHFLQEGVAEATRAKLVDAWERGKKDLMGLSIDARGKSRRGKVGRTDALLVESLRTVLSVDVVLRPSAGGGFTRLVESSPATTHQEVDMPTRVKRLLRILDAKRPQALAGVDRESVTFGDLAEIATTQELQESLREEDPAPTPVATPPSEGADTALQEARTLRSEILLDRKLQESKLPELVQKKIRKVFVGRVVSEEQIQEAIDEEREYIGKLAPARVQVPGGGARVEVGTEKLDRLQAALDRSFGLEPEDSALKTITPIGLRRLYNEITLGHDSTVTGMIQESAREAMLQEAFTSSTLPNLLANTLHRRMLKDYREPEYGEQFLYTKRPGGVPDFKAQESVRVGYFGNLSTVDPESADYQEIAAYGEEKASWSVGQRGNLVTITRKHIINDDIGHVSKVIGRLGRSARRTFAEFVWAFYTGNGAIYDSKAWFHADHDNLLTAALAVAALNSAEQTLFNQTEPDSGKKLGLRPNVLIVPIELKATAFGINQSQLVPGSANNDANPWYQRFGANNERIVVPPVLSDVTDWGVLCDQAEGDIIEVGFLNDQEEPELFTADVPTVGQMFTADKLQYKIRHEYGGAVVDFRTAVKSVVADT
jgi:hypothetical protein